MISEKLTISSTDERIRAASEFVEKTVPEWNRNPHEILRVRLLVEETMGMLRAILDEYEGWMWFEEEPEQIEIRFSLRAVMSPEKRENLIGVSTSGKNAAARGIMGKIGTIIANGLADYGYTLDLTEEYAGGPVSYWRLGVDAPTDGSELYAYDWSLSRYRMGVAEQRKENSGADEAWDELEKSIVGRLADDVKVGVRGGKIEMTILRKLKKADA